MFGHIANFIPHHDVFAVLLILSNKLALYAWNYQDILIMVMSRALYFRFDALANRKGENPNN